jgi:peptide/nickel transport system permease protein
MSRPFFPEQWSSQSQSQQNGLVGEQRLSEESDLPRLYTRPPQTWRDNFVPLDAAEVARIVAELEQPWYAKLGRVAQRVWKALMANSKVAIGSSIVAFFLLIAIFGPLFLHGDPNAITHNYLLRPSASHWLGTTNLGQDIFGQLILGTQTSVLWGLTSGIIVTVLSIVIGLLGGYFGGFTDELLSLITNIFLVMPGLPLMIVLASYVPSGPLTITLVVALTSWSWGARVMRAQTLSMRSREFVTAARSNGESTWRIIFSELFPNQISLVAANFVSTMIQVILAQAALEFLGLGDISQASWGSLLYWANANGALLGGWWWWFIPPGLCIALLGAGLSLINFGIDEIADPRLRSEPKINVQNKQKAGSPTRAYAVSQKGKRR